MNRLLLFLLVLLTQRPLRAQTFVQGRITDRQTHEPLENAVIRVRNGQSTLSDAQGNFRLPVRQPG
jgi:hypothetical protein